MLRKKINRAVLVLLVRNFAGLALSSIAFALILWKLDARQYAPIIQCQLLLSYAVGVGGLGLDAVVLRSGSSISDRSLSIIYAAHLTGTFTLLALMGVLLVILLKLPADITLIMVGSYVARAVSTIPAARLESAIEFQPQAISEFVSQGIYLGVMALLLFAGMGIYGVALGIFAAQVTYTAGLLRGGVRLPLATFSGAEISSYVREGVFIQYNTWIWQGREAAIPIILKMQGLATLLGSFGMANQIGQKINIFRQIAWRVAVPALVSETDSERKMRGIAQATEVLLIVICPLFLLLAVGIYALELYTGDRWAGVLAAFAAISMHVVLNSAFTIPCAELLASGKLRSLALFHTVFVGIFCGTLVLSARAELALALAHAEAAAAIAYSIIWLTWRLHFAVTMTLSQLITPAITVVGLYLGAALYSPVPILCAAMILPMIPNNARIIRGMVSHSVARARSYRSVKQ